MVVHSRPLPFLSGAYTRSMTVIDRKMYFVSGHRAVTVVDHTNDGYSVLETYPVVKQYASMNDLVRIGDAYYISATLNRLVRCEDWEALGQDRCESVYEDYGLRGNPYHFSYFDGRYYLGEVAGRDAILAFESHRRSPAI